MTEAWTTKPGQVYAWLKEERHTPVIMLEDGQGSMTGNVEEMDDLLRSSWMPIMRKYGDGRGKEPPVEEFMNRYRKHITYHAMEIEPITGARLHKKFCAMAVTSEGVDGWRLQELRDLPLALHGMLAGLLGRVEATGAWPRMLALGLITLTPKGEGVRPLEMRPLSVLSLIYRAWGGLRMTDCLEWQEGWIHKEAQAFRRQRGSMDVAGLIQLLMEKSRRGGNPIAGMGKDYRKCFDLVPHAISFEAAREQGLHPSIAMPLEGMFRDLRRAFKVNGCVGRFTGATNGILQGCALSTILVNVVMTIWMKEVDHHMPMIKIQVRGLPPRPPVWEAVYDESGKRRGRVEVAQPSVDPRPLEVAVSAVGYCDDCYAMGETTEELEVATPVTEEWLDLTGQEINANKSVVFATKPGRHPPLLLQGVALPLKESFRSLGIEVAPAGEKGMGAILGGRVAKAHHMLKRAVQVEGGFTKRAMLISSLIIASGLYGVAAARTNPKSMLALETAVMNCVWGTSKTTRAKEVVFNLLLPGHRMAPTLYVPYNRVMWLAGLARRQLTTMYVAQEIWEQGGVITPEGPMGRAMEAVADLGWQALEGWWAWSVPDQNEEVHFVYDTPSRLGHIIRESLRSKEMRSLEGRRPRQFTGVSSGPNREILRAAMDSFSGPGETQLVSQILVGAVWTEERAHRRKMVLTPTCPYCEVAVEDEQHIFWECPHWGPIREELMKEVIELAKQVPGLGDGRWQEWPICVRMVGIVPQNVGDVWTTEGTAQLLAFVKALLSQYVVVLMARG